MGEARRRSILQKKGLLTKVITNDSIKKPESVLEHIGRIIKDVLKELKDIGQQNSCIFAGYILTEVLKKEGFDAYVLTARVRILDPITSADIKKTGVYEIKNILDQPSQSSSQIFVGYGQKYQGDQENQNHESDDAQWAGHLVVIIPNLFKDKSAMCDLTIPQASKKEWGFNLVPVCTRVQNKFLTGEDICYFEINQCLAFYDAFPADDSYKDSQIWTDRHLFGASVQRVLEAR
jgi:hypothetical protein